MEKTLSLVLACALLIVAGLGILQSRQSDDRIQNLTQELLEEMDRTRDQNARIAGEKHKLYEGKTLRVLIDGETGKDEYNLSSRTNGGRLVHLKGDKSLVGEFAEVKITNSNNWALYGELIEK